MNRDNAIKVIEACKAKLALRRKARTSFIDYLKDVWWMPHPFIEGRHTRIMCDAVDRAVARYLQGESSFLLVEVPFRHGKSDVFSRALPGYFLARCALSGLDPDVMMTGYGTLLIEGFSTDAKQIINSDSYKNTFPTVRLAKGANNKGEWRLAGAYGKVVATGLGGGLTGKGYGLGVVDDYFKNREEAESETYREKVWNHIKDDFMTRRAPHSVTVIVATPWHTDGPGGRILKAMEEDPDFPRFEHIRLPARERVEGQWDNLPDGRRVSRYRYLFPERYSDAWYRSQYATLGTYSAAGLLDCNPVPAEGNVARREWFPVVDALPASVEQEVRYWDLAATAKKNADYTCGCKMLKAEGIYCIADLSRSQTAAGGIRKLIQNTASQDGWDCPIRIEQEGGSAGKILSVDFAMALDGYEIYFNHPTGDKLTRALPFFAQAEAGNVRLLRGAWNKAFLDEVVEAPNGKNDDTWDSAAGAFYHLTRPSAG